MDIERALEALRLEAEAYRSKQHGKRGYRWPEQYKIKIRSIYKEGVSARQLSERLGISNHSINSWVGEERGKPRFQRRGLFRQLSVSGRPARLILLGPKGYRVEGLSVQEITELIEAGVM